MAELEIYREDMQRDIEAFFQRCFLDLGWRYEPDGRHGDIAGIQEAYMSDGCFWCLFDEGRLVGTVAVRSIPGPVRTAEMKRLYVLPDCQGKGYGRLLFEVALDYVKKQGYDRVCVDTRRDRSASQHLIRRHGFREIPQYNDNAFAELFFELRLT